MSDIDEQTLAEGDAESGAPTETAPPAPTTQDAIPVDRLADALIGAYQKTFGQQQQAPVPTDPLAALSPEQRQRMADLSLTDPIEFQRQVSALQDQVNQRRLQQQALPMITTAANQIVEIYKMRKQRSDPYFNKIEPLFDKMMVGIDVTPLVNMSEATRNHELDLRWNAASSQILRDEVKRARPEPKLISNSGGGTPGPKAKPSVLDDPWMQKMKEEYNLSDEQIAEIEAENG